MTADPIRCAGCGSWSETVRVSSVRIGLAVIVDREGRSREVATDLVPGVRAGDTVLIEAGVVLARIEAPSP